MNELLNIIDYLLCFIITYLPSFILFVGVFLSAFLIFISIPSSDKEILFARHILILIFIFSSFFVVLYLAGLFDNIYYVKDGCRYFPWINF